MSTDQWPRIKLVMIRIANNRDSQGVIDLISNVYAEYNDRVCLDGAEADLLDLQASYADIGGCFWVLEIGGQIKGSHAALPDPEDASVCGFRRLYLAADLRGSHWGHDLMQVTIDWARDSGFREVRFWSDTRFERAHRFFEKFGFRRDGRVREMHDSHETYHEYFFSLQL